MWAIGDFIDSSGNTRPKPIKKRSRAILSPNLLAPLKNRRKMLKLGESIRRVELKGVRRWMSSVVMSFGDGHQGALGLPTSTTGHGGDAYEPTPVPGLPSDVTTVSAGHYHSLALTSQAQLWAWGRNNEAQLGRGLQAPRSLSISLSL